MVHGGLAVHQRIWVLLEFGGSATAVVSHWQFNPSAEWAHTRRFRGRDAPVEPFSHVNSSSKKLPSPFYGPSMSTAVLIQKESRAGKEGTRPLLLIAPTFLVAAAAAAVGCVCLMLLL